MRTCDGKMGMPFLFQDQVLKKLVIMWSKLPVVKQTELAKYFEKTKQLTATVKGVTVGPSIKEADLAWRSLNGALYNSSIPAARRLKSTAWAAVINRWHWIMTM
jgi:hypothetical protein